jgi:hypothetical protein
LFVVAAGIGREFQVTGVTPGISVVNDVWYVPEATAGGTAPNRVQVNDKNGSSTVLLASGERYLTGAGDHGVLLATDVRGGSALTLRTGAVDAPVVTLPAGVLGKVVADASTALVAFTPDGSSVPVIKAISLTGGTVTAVSTTPLTTTTPLLALTAGTFAWSDATEVVRVPRAGGAELRRSTGPVTALAAQDDSTAWISGGHLLTAVLDGTASALDHGAVTEPTLIARISSDTYGVSIDSGSFGQIDFFTAAKQARSGANPLGQRDADLADVRLNAGLVVRHFTSAPGVAKSRFSTNSSGGLISSQTDYCACSPGRRLLASSGRFAATGNADDTSVTLSTTLPAESVAPGPNLTIPVSTGVDTIELSGMRLLVHRPGSSTSQLYTLGSATPVDFPLTASLFGERVAWLNPDGSIQTRDVVTGVTVTIRPAGTAACIGEISLAATTIRVAGDSVFWSLCGENRVHRVSLSQDAVLPDGDMTNARLGTGVLAVVDPTTKVLSVIDLDTLTSYPVSQSPITFDVDEKYVAWANATTATYVAPLPYDNSDVTPQVLAEWSDTGVVPQQYAGNRVSFWHVAADFTQPVAEELSIPSIGFVSSGITPSGFPYLPGSLSGDYNGADYRTSAEPAAPPGQLSWSLAAQPTSGSSTTLTGTLAVRDPRTPSATISSWPKTLVAGAKGTINLKLFLGNAGYPGQPITAQARAHGTAAWKTIKSVTTSSTGTLAFVEAPTTNTDMRFLYSGAAYGPVASSSATITTSVAQRISAKLSASSARTGRVVVLSVGITPARPNQVVTMQRYYSGAWHNVANLRLNSASAYRYSLKAVRGSASYRVIRAADARNLAGTSATVVLKGT